MRYTRLARSDLQVSTISFGTWAFGGDWGAFDRDEATSAIHRALDLGITFFDTAQAYGFGVSERLLGEALRGAAPREDIVIATKGGLRKDGDALVRDAGRSWLRSGVESSLRNLGVDHVDLYQVHWPDEHTPAEETAAALEELVDEGKIRHVGVSNYGVKEMDALASHGRLETLQPPYHMFRREIEDEILPYADEHDVGVLVYGPMAHGILTGRITYWTRFSSQDWRASSPDFEGSTFRRNLETVARLKEFAQARLVTLPELAVAWTLANPAVDVAIVGARRPSQLEGTVTAAEIDMSGEDLRAIGDILAGAVAVRGPHPEAMP